MSIDRARMRFILIPCLLVLFLTVVACGGGSKSKEPSRWDKTSTPSSSSSSSSSQAKGKVVDGSKFNRYFPKGGGGYDLSYDTTPSQEKKGFAQAKLKQKGKTVATLAVSDTNSNPSAVDKYKNSPRKIGGYPASDVGNNGDSILVANRFQVQVRSSDKSFTKQNREEWLQKFNLSGLESVK